MKTRLRNPTSQRPGTATVCSRELAQNAADAAAREGVEGSLWVDVDGRTMTVANTGRPLDEPGVHALTALRASNKVDADEGVTGRFGVGFSAVLSVSDEVELRSSTGSIRFSASHTLREIESRELPVPETGVPVLRLVWPLWRIAERWC